MGDSEESVRQKALVEGLAASVLSDPSDPTRLQWVDIRDSWGSWTNFVLSYNLKPYELSELEQALEISRALKLKINSG